VTIEVLSR